MLKTSGRPLREQKREDERKLSSSGGFDELAAKFLEILCVEGLGEHLHTPELHWACWVRGRAITSVCHHIMHLWPVSEPSIAIIHGGLRSKEKALIHSLEQRRALRSFQRLLRMGCRFLLPGRVCSSCGAARMMDLWTPANISQFVTCSADLRSNNEGLLYCFWPRLVHAGHIAKCLDQEETVSGRKLRTQGLRPITNDLYQVINHNNITKSREPEIINANLVMHLLFVD